MEIKFDYCIRRKSDNKLMQILHTTMTEDEIIEAVKGKLTAPINYSMDEDGEYRYADIYIEEISGLK